MPSPRAPSLLLLLLLTLAALPFTALCRPPWLGRLGGGDLNASKKYEGSSSFVHLRYHMGPVLTANVTVHVIWYGKWAPAHKRTIRAFINSIGPSGGPSETPEPSASAWWGTVRLYTDQTGANITRIVRMGEEKNDRGYSYGRRLTRMRVQDIIRDAVTARTRPLPVNPRGGMYLVLTAEDVHMEDFCEVCGFHYFTFPSIVGYTMPYAWVGNSATQCPGFCAYPFAITSYPGNAPRSPEKPPNGDPGVDGMVSVIAHELAEMASNPLANAWYAGSDPSFPTEIADLCLGIYGTGGGGAYTGQLMVDERNGGAYNVNGIGGRRFLVQWIWNPVLNYCTGPNALDQ